MDANIEMQFSKNKLKSQKSIGQIDTIPEE